MSFCGVKFTDTSPCCDFKCTTHIYIHLKFAKFHDVLHYDWIPRFVCFLHPGNPRVLVMNYSDLKNPYLQLLNLL